MCVGRTARPLVAAAIAVLVCGLALAISVHAQLPDDTDTLVVEVGKLHAAGKHAEATAIAKRLLALHEKTLGPEHPGTWDTVKMLAALYLTQDRLAEAEQLVKRLEHLEGSPDADDRDVDEMWRELAALYLARGHLAEAEPLYKRILARTEKAWGPDDPSIVEPLDTLAQLYHAQGRYAEAEPLFKRTLALREKVDGPDHLSVAAALNNLADLYRAQGRHAEAEPLFKRSLSLREKALGPDHPLVAESLNNLALLGIDGRLAAIDARLAGDCPDYAALASPRPVSVADVQASLRGDEALVLFLDTDTWRSNAPNSTSLPEETFVWVVTKSEVRWVRSELGTPALQREVAALRCGLDDSLWGDRDKRARCVALLEVQGYDAKTELLPFPVARAHALYKALLGQAEDLIEGKHLLIVPSGALTQLPFQVLVTTDGVRPCGSNPMAQPCKGGNRGKDEVGAKGSDPRGLTPYRTAAWLGVRQPITVLPAVSSLKALRAHAKASRAGNAYLGIGNPLLDGPDARFAEDARKARASVSCPVAPTRVATLDAGQGGVAPVEVRGGLAANVADIRAQAPLPETADELCAVARDLQADVSEVRLGDRATETEIKRLSRSGELAGYRVLHFATHGAMAGELDKDSEPGLILTPPPKGSREDDGYLSASEIAGLKLDADWVILSACNTAAGGASSAEALSGIARAFIHAGACALLVSHWAVDSNATVRLVTKAAAEMAGDTKVGRAEAMRRAMQALIEKGASTDAHPAYWAPFVVVGEGAPAR